MANAHRRRSVAKVEDLDPTSSRAVAEYRLVLDDAAFGGATPIEPKAISPTDPAGRYAASANSVAGYAYSDNYLIDLKHAVIMDVEATTTIRQAEVGAAKTMLDRTAEQFEVVPSRLVADAGYGSAEMIGWLVDERGIEPHVKLMDKSERTDGTFSRSDFAFDPEGNLYVYLMSRTKECRDALRSSEAHPQTRSIAPPWPERRQGRVPIGRHYPKSAETGETHPLPGAGLRPVRRRGAALLRWQPPLTNIVLAYSSTKST